MDMRLVIDGAAALFLVVFAVTRFNQSRSDGQGSIAVKLPPAHSKAEPGSSVAPAS